MEIKIQIKGRVFSICFGRDNKWFQSADWFSIIEEWYDDPDSPLMVTYAKQIVSWFPSKEWKKMIEADREKIEIEKEKKRYMDILIEELENEGTNF